jgi:hypothetical protein
MSYKHCWSPPASAIARVTRGLTGGRVDILGHWDAESAAFGLLCYPQNTAGDVWEMDRQKEVPQENRVT